MPNEAWKKTEMTSRDGHVSSPDRYRGVHGNTAYALDVKTMFVDENGHRTLHGTMGDPIKVTLMLLHKGALVDQEIVSIMANDGDPPEQVLGALFRRLVFAPQQAM